MKRTLIAGLILCAALTLTAAAQKSAAQKPQAAEALLGAAIHQEEAEGNLEAAIASYKKFLTQYGNNRPLAAKAQYHLGLAYEKLGNAEARKAYERVVREFADQKEVAAMSRTRLEAMQSPATRVVQAARRIWVNAGITVTPPSADGRYLAFSDDDVAVRDLKEGTNRRLTNAAISGGKADYVAISPDGRQVAYGWITKTGYELRILPVTATESTQPRILHCETACVPLAWTPDGKGVLVMRDPGDRTRQMASISIADESVHALKSLGSNFPFRISVSPDGRHIAYDIPGSENVAARDIFVLNADGSGETAVAPSPANDTEPMWSPDGSQLIFVSNRSGKRALWSVPMDGGTPKGPAELLNADIPASFYGVGVTGNGALYYGQNVGLTNVYTADLDDKLNLRGKPARISDRGINSNSRPGWSRDGQSLAYVSYRGDSPVLVIRSLNSGEEREIPSAVLQNPFAGPLTWFPDGRSVLVTSIDSQKSRIGYHRVDVVSGRAELLHYSSNRVLSAQRPGLSPDGKTIFYSDLDSEGPTGRLTPKLVRFDIESGRETVLKRGGFVTSVAVSPDGSQLAYTVSEQPPRSASVEVMPAAGGESREVFHIDAWLDDYSRFAGLAWSPDQRYLLFVKPEKADRNPRETLLWRVPITGGKPENVGISMDILRFPRIHPDGRRLVFESMVPESREVWALENYLPPKK